MEKERLYKLVSKITPYLIPVAAALRSIAGSAGARLVPIVEYSHLGLRPEMNRDWSILDTFDMYSPAHDHPQRISTVTQWFKVQGFTDLVVLYGGNGVVGRGKKPIPNSDSLPYQNTRQSDFNTVDSPLLKRPTRMFRRRTLR